MTSNGARFQPGRRPYNKSTSGSCVEPLVGECGCFGGYRTGLLPSFLEGSKDGNAEGDFTPVAPVLPEAAETAAAKEENTGAGPVTQSNGEGVTPNETASPGSGQSYCGSESTTEGAKSSTVAPLDVSKQKSETGAERPASVPRLRLGGEPPTIGKGPAPRLARALSMRFGGEKSMEGIPSLSQETSSVERQGLVAGAVAAEEVASSLAASEDPGAPSSARPASPDFNSLKQQAVRSMTPAQRSFAKSCIRKVKAMDHSTRVPFVMVELRGYGEGQGSIEISGKDEYDVYKELHKWLTETLGCIKMDALIDEDSKLTFCDARYCWDGFRELDNGMNNIGFVTMQLVELMCGKLSWTLGMVNGGNLGTHGEIRDQQVIFKAPHPMNMTAPHVLLEMRSDGSMQLTGSDTQSMDTIERILLGNFSSKRATGFEEFCHRHYKTGEGVFLERGTHGENNMGLLTVRICDLVVQNLEGWSLVTMNGGNYGEDGRVREQQLFFRRDEHPLREAPHLMVELREVGYVEFSGENVHGIHERLEEFLTVQWHCSVPAGKPSTIATLKRSDDETASEVSESDCARMISSASATNYYHRKLVWPPRDMLVVAAELTGFFHQLGWQMLVCSTGAVAVEGYSGGAREQQILFRPQGSQKGLLEPHLFIELNMGDVEEDMEETQIPKNQSIRLRSVGECRQGTRKVGQFIQWLGGTQYVDDGQNQSFHIEIFMTNGLEASNLGQWTMRICDLIVDRLDWSFVVCNVCNLGKYGQRREQQLVFRYDGERPEMPVARGEHGDTILDKSRFKDFKFPSYYTSPEVLGLEKAFSIVPCQPTEVQAIQEIFDATYRKLNERNPPIGFSVIQAFRCEHADLLKSFVDRRMLYKGGHVGGAITAMTEQGGVMLNNRLHEGEALLMHGTNPSTALSILKSGFVLGNVGKAHGVTFGSGIYLAESISLCDTYASDDKGGNYPGLLAVLLCRCLIGRGMQVADAGDYVMQARQRRYDCVVGEEKMKIGKFRHFVFWDDAQVLPEYAVIYRRRCAALEPVWMRQRMPTASGDQKKCCCNMQ